LRLAEERIARRFDTVEEEPRLVVDEARGHLAAQHVDAMAARRQRLPELGRDDAAAADRGITDDADVHFISVSRTSGSRTTKPSAQRTPASAPNCASRLSISWRKSGVFSRVAAAPLASGRANWLAWQSSARRLTS